MNSFASFTDHPASQMTVTKLEVAINGKFLRPTAGKSGVYRVACELLFAIDLLLSTRPDLASRFSCRVIGPACLPPEFSLKTIRFQNIGRFVDSLNDTAWEQIGLPWAARGKTLVNLCNVGPAFFGNAITMIHDAQVHESPQSYSRAFRLWYRILQPRLGRKNKSILTVSGFSRDQLVSHGIAPASRVRVIHNGCDHVLRLKPDISVVQRCGLTALPYVVALSNTQVHKNIAILFEAFESEALRDMTLVLFGSASRADFERLGHTVPTNVRFIGRIDDQELCGLLKSAVALAFPSLTEGFGLPPLEAMALGCPAIVAPCGALSEICGDAALWADPHDAEQWAKQIKALYGNPAYAAEVIAKGRVQAAQFTWENAAKQLLEIVSLTS